MPRLAEAFVEVSAKFKDVDASVRKDATKTAKAVEQELGKKTGKAAEDAGKESGKRFSNGLKSAVSGAGAAVGAAAAGGILAFGAALAQGAKDAASYEVVTQKTNAVIESTGNVANISTKGVTDLAASLETLSGVDEELIINGQNVLATFTNVRNEAGKGNAVFDDATKAALNLSVALGTDIQQSALLVGKALNDPIKGVTALRRSGVQLTQQQQDQVKAFVESGNTLEAQKIILGELETQFGGVAAAAGDSLTGDIARAQDAFSDLFRELGANLIPALGDAAEFVTDDVIPAMKTVGEIVYDVGSTITTVIGAIPTPVALATAGIVGLALTGPKLAALGATVSGAILGPFQRFSEQMQVQTHLAERYGKQLTTTGAATATFRTRLSGLGGVTGALRKGFSGFLNLLGGPWTVAVTGAIAGLTYLFTRQSAAEKAAEAHKTAFEGLTDALVASKGKYTDTILEQVVKGLEDTSILDNTKHLGLNVKDLTNAVTQGGPAFKEFRKQLGDVALESDKFAGLGTEQRQFLAGLANQLALTGGSAEQFSFVIDELTSSYASNTDATDEQRAQMHLLITELLDLAGGTKLARDENRKHSESAKRQSEANKEAKSSAQGAAGAIKAQALELDKLIQKEQERAGVILSSREAQRAYQESIDAARASLKENGATLDINSAKGRANQAALDAVANAALAQAAAMERNGASQETVARKIGTARSEFIKTARQMGLSKTEAKKLADQLRLIPGRYVADVDASTKDAVSKITSFFNKYDGLRFAINLTPFGVAFEALKAATGNRAAGGPGGPVRGPGTGTSDTAGLYALSNGEHVLTEREVRGAGGHSAIYAQRARWRVGNRREGGPGGPVLDMDLAGVDTAAAQFNAVAKAFGKIGAAYGSGPTSPGLNGALQWARSQAGKPYIWGGVGPAGYDCSGFMSAITNVIRGRSPHSRVGSTASFPWGGFTAGRGPFSIGSVKDTGSGIGHMAGTLNGVNVESRGTDGVVVGPSARGATNGLFGGNVYSLRGFRAGGEVDVRRGDPPYDLLRSSVGRKLAETLGIMHNGGVVPKTGRYLLQRGESVTAARDRGAATTTVHIDLSNSVIASERQLEEMLTRALQRMSDRGRLKFA